MDKEDKPGPGIIVRAPKEAAPREPKAEAPASQAAPKIDDRASIVAWLRRTIHGEVHEVRTARLRYADEIEAQMDLKVS